MGRQRAGARAPVGGQAVHLPVGDQERPSGPGVGRHGSGAAVVCVRPRRLRTVAHGPLGTPGPPCSITARAGGPAAVARGAAERGRQVPCCPAPAAAPIIRRSARPAAAWARLHHPAGFGNAAIHAPGHQVVGGPRRHHHPGAELRGLRNQRRVHRREPHCGGDGGRCRGADRPLRPPVSARPATRAGAHRPLRSHARGGPSRRAHGPGAQPPRPRISARRRSRHARAARRRRQRAGGAGERACLQQRSGRVRPRALRPGARAQQHDARRVRGSDPRRPSPRPARRHRRRRAQGAGVADRGPPPLPGRGAQRRSSRWFPRAA